MPKPTMAELRNAAIEKRNAIHAEINAEFSEDLQNRRCPF